jgi:hypothetical protein
MSACEEAISTIRMRASQPGTGQTETSTAKTRLSSQSQGWRLGGGAGSSAGTSPAAKSSSCSGSGRGSLRGTTSERTLLWAASTP